MFVRKTVGGVKWLLDDWLLLGQMGFQTISFSFWLVYGYI